MNIQINGKETATTAATVAELAAQMQLPEQGVAIAVGNQMVPRAAWADTPLAEGARVTIIKAACGG
ncbi:MAG: sulfur carrier protein ThiS [Bacteroidales bacterium]|nr:sulfur carrier protein ThiS [Bacteroidales bacterium]